MQKYRSWLPQLERLQAQLLLYRGGLAFEGYCDTPVTAADQNKGQKLKKKTT